MKKFLTIPVLAAFLAVAACTGTEEEKAAKRETAVMLAVDRIERFNSMGIDPVQLDPVYLLGLDTACVTVLVLGPEVGLEENTLKNVSAACDVIMKAATKAEVSS